MITIFDITIFTTITIFIIFGVYQGIIGFTIKIVGFIGAIILTYFLAPYFLEIINKYIANEIVGIITSGVISYIISLILCAFVTHKILLMLSFIRGGFIDKLLGLLLGLSVGTIFSMMLFFIIIIFTTQKDNVDINNFENFIKKSEQDKYAGVLADSMTTRYLDEITRAIIIVVPEISFKSIKFLDNKRNVKYQNSSDDKQIKRDQELINNLHDKFKEEGVFSLIEDKK